MESIRICNFRSLVDTNFIELKPITLLVGKNSSGKSSFLRTFPLLRQSVEERTTGPLLWYGRYVDFGSFSESICSNAKDETIRIGFSVSIDEREIRFRNKRPTKLGEKKYKIVTDVSIKQISSKNEEFVSQINIDVEDKHHFRLEFSPKGIIEKLYINNNEIVSKGFIVLQSIYSTNSSIIPNFRFSLNEDILKKIDDQLSDDNTFSSKEKIAITRHYLNMINEFAFYQSEIYDDLKITRFIDNENMISVNEITDLLTSIDNFDPNMLSDIAFLSKILDTLQVYFVSFSKNCTYIAPVRATAERFYRPQNLSVDEVDFQGKNLAVYLKSLNTHELRRFTSWTEKHFNFSVNVRASLGHLSIYIKEDGKDRNLADTGFGYSQILPVITQLWSFVNSRMKSHRFPILFAIEQPELHLHPSMQAKFADSLVDVIEMSKEEGIYLKLLIETHSEAIVNRLGHRVSNDDIDPSNINIVIFEKEEFDKPTSIRVGYYNNDGFLQNWPYGFFEPDFEG